MLGHLADRNGFVIRICDILVLAELNGLSGEIDVPF
ncbi:hypothetical protein MnTg02_03156 [bacterium MnTg02]|nr:hypothetical protein MnTg02_03156 [bacterium MnTg02]